MNRQLRHTCRWRRFGSVLIGVALLVSAIDARQVPATPEYISADRGLSIDQLVTGALDRSPVILAARTRVDAVKAERLQADLRPNPTLLSDWREQVGGSDRQTLIGLSWPLDLSRKDGRVAVTESRVASAEQQARDVERTVTGAVRASALRFLAAVRQLQVRQQIATTLRQFRDLVGARADSGAAPPLERDIADVDARRAEAEVLQQRAAVAVSLAELKAVVGLTPDQPLLLRVGLEQVARAGELPTLAPASSALEPLQARSDIQLAENQVRAASAEVDLVRREAKPDVSVNAAYMRMAAGFPFLGVTAGGSLAPIQDVFHSFSVGASVSLPWRDRRQGDIAAATARVQTAERDLEARRLAAAAEVEAARSRVSQLDAALALYESGLLSLAGRNVDVVRQSYELGRATLIDVLNETRRLLDTETAYTHLLLETLEARSDLATALGVIR